MQILNKLRGLFGSLNADSEYTYLNGEKYIQKTSKSTSVVITNVDIGVKFREGFLRDSTIINNLQVIDTLIQYDMNPYAIINIKKNFFNNNVWKVKVSVQGLDVFSSEIRFSDDKPYETFLLKWRFSIK